MITLAGFLFILMGTIIISGIVIINSKKVTFSDTVLTTMSITMIILGSVFLTGDIMTIKEQCEEASISYTFVQTIAEMTNTSEEDVFIISKYAEANEYEFYDVIKMIDSSLSDEEVNAIIIISNMKERVNN